MATPESKVKAAVKRELDKYPGHYREMPVPGGYGKSGLDFTVCFYGWFVAIETKAHGKTPTARQHLRMEEIRAAGGYAFAVDGTDHPASLASMNRMCDFRNHLRRLANYPARP